NNNTNYHKYNPINNIHYNNTPPINRNNTTGTNAGYCYNNKNLYIQLMIFLYHILNPNRRHANPIHIHNKNRLK
ncbi:hypothetical protein BDFB_015125, partial [Asbolus verrucosus]